MTKKFNYNESVQYLSFYDLFMEEQEIGVDLLSG